jgi:hypothetical protein
MILRVTCFHTLTVAGQDAFSQSVRLAWRHDRCLRSLGGDASWASR